MCRCRNHSPMKRKLSTLLAMVMVSAFCLTGCGNNTKQPDAPTEPASADEPVTANEPTPDAPEEQPEEEPAEDQKPEKATSGDTAILVVSFGTSYEDNRSLSIGGVEDAIKKAFPEYDIRRAFTAQIVIDRVAREQGEEIDNVQQALDRAVADGVKNLVIQPTHLMNGFEYEELMDEVNNYWNDFDQIVVGEPLLTSDEDFNKVIAAITAETASYADDGTAIVFMGHGTEAESNQVYGKLQTMLTEAGFGNYFIGTVEADPEDPESWYSVLTAEGYEVEALLKGLGEISAIQELYVAHTQAAIDSLAQ